MKGYLFTFIMLLSLFSCVPKDSGKISLLNASAFEKEVNGKLVSLYTIDSGNGLVVQVTNLGLRVVSIWTADKDGEYADVAVGYENIDRYLNNEGERFLGSIVGRYANRISKGRFMIDSVQYQLPLNNNGQTLHGGLKGLDMRVWNVDRISDKSIDFSYVSPDNEEGFPGTLNIKVRYSVTSENEFKIIYEATTDKPTVVNLSNHAFFNLKGESGGTITDHILTINADSITLVDSLLIPTGEIVSVDGTPFDFRNPVVIGSRINMEDEQLRNGLGYDHNWVLNTEEDITRSCATLESPATGIILDVYTNEPGIQVYCGNFLDGTLTGKKGIVYNFREAVCLETDKYPDTPNKPEWPSAVLRPGEKYQSQCIYKFSVHK